MSYADQRRSQAMIGGFVSPDRLGWVASLLLLFYKFGGFLVISLQCFALGRHSTFVIRPPPFSPPFTAFHRSLAAMKSTALVAPFVLLAISAARATPLVERAPSPSQMDILQLGLTLEHLEDAFYTGALSKFNEAAFEKAGMPAYVRNRFQQIGQHEASHVRFLTNAIGADAVSACVYDFTSAYASPKAFLAASQILEGVGTSAYLGAAQDITDPDTLTDAGAILAVEAQHNSWISSTGLMGTPWSGPFDTPLDQNQVFTLASSYIVSCPKSNPTLPFTAFPPLSVSGTPTSGQSVQLSFDYSGSDQLYLGIFTGLDKVFAPIDGQKKVTIPSGLQGTAYAIVANDRTGSDASTIAGPAVLSFGLPSNASNE
ncbi:hypothetical protein EW145_g3932 [Phellinidium pouzarii]|uniref:Ferritin-like domain-containing protein n=1 Tax=Phellinidium pouzarii TaxID=167371 RepID=A0A4S4L5U0_9AGAM|nr:hypothetical protein EW145_g3932 [Phellinidium pouzarii]